MGCSPWGREEPDTTECLQFHFSLSCIGEGNGNPLQCSCLENPRDGGAWWAAVYGVAQSWTRLKPLSSSSSNSCVIWRCSEDFGLAAGLELMPRPFKSHEPRSLRCYPAPYHVSPQGLVSQDHATLSHPHFLMLAVAPGRPRMCPRVGVTGERVERAPPSQP